MAEFYEIFCERIKDRVLEHLIFIEYDLKNGKYNKYHHENNEDASSKIGNLLKEYLPYCVYSEQEFIEWYEKGQFDDLDKMIKVIKKNRLPNRHGDQNGIYSETLLDLLIMLKNPNTKKACIRTVHRQRTDNNEIKGFDSVHMLKNKNEILLILGQAKLGDRTYCINKIKEDLEKMDFLYTYDELTFIVDKRLCVDSEIKDILSELNDLFFDLVDKSVEERRDELEKYFEMKNINIIVPCLLAYEKKSIYTQDFDNQFEAEIKSIINSVKDYKCALNLNTKLMFMFFPIYSKSDLRKGMGIDE
ncbi:MAG: hypothetical protein IKM20_00545 [Erysipelotrichales bacterium]|nr:hypothetical protein [Erysipelotrichales bacterium]